MTNYPRIDNLQYANWSEKIFQQMVEGRFSLAFRTLPLSKMILV